MVDFPKLLKIAKKSFIDKYLKKRVFGRCIGRDAWDLLIEFYEIDNKFLLCEACYNRLIHEEEI